MCRTEHCFPKSIQFDKEIKKSERHFPVNVSRRFVGKDNIRRQNHCSGERRPLPLSPGQFRGKPVGNLFETDPVEQLGEVLFGQQTVLSRYCHWEKYVVAKRQMVNEPAVLMNDTNPLPQPRDSIPVKRR